MAIAAACALPACSSCSKARAESADDEGWTGHARIAEVLEMYCSGCHGAAWSSCWDVQASKLPVTWMVSSGAMPRVGTLRADDKAALLDWLEAGAPCSGTGPEGEGDPRQPPASSGF